MSCPGYKYTLSCCMNMKNEGKFLKEWLDHYISEGVEHFYLIDNGSDDNYNVKIEPYMNKITLIKDDYEKRTHIGSKPKIEHFIEKK